MQVIQAIWDQRGSLQAALVLCTLLVAIRKGAGPERWCAAILMGVILLARFEQMIVSGFETVWGLSGFETRAVAYLTIDLLAFLGLGTIGIFANRIYPLWMAGLQLTALLTHIASRTTDIVAPLAYAVLNLSTFYLEMLVLGLGLAAHIRREREWGTYPSWRGASLRSPAPMPTRWRSG